MALCRALILLTLMSLCAQSGCAVTDVGNPPDARASVAVSFLLRDEGAPFKVEQAWFSVGDVRLIDAQGCDPATAPVDLSGPLVLTQTAQALSSSLELDVAAASFCKLGLVMKPDQSMPLNNASLVVQGRRRSDDKPMLVRVALDDRLGLGWPQGSSLGLSEAERASLVIVLEAKDWFDAQSLDAATQLDGQIVVGDGSNAPLVDALVEALSDRQQRGARLVRDLDLDGSLSDQELNAPVAQGGLEEIE